ncbi:MAG: hypothetical protein ACYS99_01050 [Planctomycetota bacterium]
MSPILLREIFRIIVEELDDIGPPEDAKAARILLHQFDQLAERDRDLGCIPGSDKLLTLREACGDGQISERRVWAFSELLEKYLPQDPALAREREHLISADNRVRRVVSRTHENIASESDPRARRNPRAQVRSGAGAHCGSDVTFLMWRERAENLLGSNLPLSARARERLLAVMESQSFREAARRCRENPGSFHKALGGLKKSARRRYDWWQKCGLAKSAARSSSEHRGIAMVFARDVVGKTPDEIAMEFGHATPRSGSAALSRARRTVTRLAEKARMRGLSPTDLPIPRD